MIKSFIKNTKNQYDVIIYGLLDAQTNLSSKGGIRLDSYVYTVDAFDPRLSRTLKSDGFIYVSYKCFKLLSWVT